MLLLEIRHRGAEAGWQCIFIVIVLRASAC